jgi:hypothetical protein
MVQPLLTIWALAAGIGLVLTEGDWSDGKPAIVVLDLIPGTPAHTAVEVNFSRDAHL